MKRMMKAILLTCIMATSTLAGCFADGEEPEVIMESEFFNFEVGDRTWYHYPGGIDAMNNTSALGGQNSPFQTSGTYLQHRNVYF